MERLIQKFAHQLYTIAGEMVNVTQSLTFQLFVSMVAPFGGNASRSKFPYQRPFSAVSQIMRISPTFYQGIEIPWCTLP